MSSILIYKNEDTFIKIDFYKRPAIVELFKSNDIQTKIDINGKYLEGNRETAERLSQWLDDNKTSIEDIVWEWETGKDEVPLIENKFI